jgi:hypothetical protein
VSTGGGREYRDEVLGNALRQLEVPEHRQSFHADLRRLLAEERIARRRFRGAPKRVNRARLAVALVAALVAVLIMAIGIPLVEHSSRLGGPQPVDAALIKAKVRLALGTMRNLRGILVYDGPRKDDEKRWRFTLTAQGDFELDGPGRGEWMAYDASAGIARAAQRSESLGGVGPLFYSERRGLAPGLPDPGPPSWLIPTEMGAFVRALLAADDPRVRVTVYESRPAWTLGVDTVPNAIVPEFTGDRFQITVDQESGMPVRVVERKAGAVIRELRIEDLAVNVKLAPGAFEHAFPAGAEVARMDEGFERVGLDKVGGIVGYQPLVPHWLPDGYKLAEVAVARKSGPTGAEGGNPASRSVVSLSYRRGFDQVLVTTRIAAGGPWSDPLATGEGYVDRPERVVLEAGALAGRPAELLLEPRGIPHLWTRSDALVVTVSGALGKAELLRVAESLERR